MASISESPKCPVCSKTELIAQIAHIINNDLRAYFGQEPSRVKLNTSAVIESVAQTKLDPEQNWLLWKRTRLNDGWVYGEKYDQDKKVHPNLVENYEDLPEKEKVKDYVYWAVVKSCVLYADAVRRTKERGF